MWCAITGDYVGSAYEAAPLKGYDLPLVVRGKSTITDDTVLLAASVDALLHNRSFDEAYRDWAGRYPGAGYGARFSAWLGGAAPGDSFGNGAAVRAAPIGWIATSEEEALRLARDSAICSHDHPEALSGAQAIALSVYCLRAGLSPEQLGAKLHAQFDYLLYFDLDQLSEDYSFDSSAENTVPLAIYIGLQAKSHEDCLRKCLLVGGDTDTIMTMACAIYEARPAALIDRAICAQVRHHVQQHFPDIAKMIDALIVHCTLRDVSGE